MLPSVKDVLLRLSILLVFYDCATCLIIPEELPTILSLIYSNIPPIKKGTDSRIGVGFRLGEHADFQVLLELGPQTETAPIGNADSKRRRAATLGAAMRGELGPLAQAVAKYQIERKLQREVERLKTTENARKKTESENNQDKKSASNDWLTKWSKEIARTPEDQVPLEEIEKTYSSFVETEPVHQRIGRPTRTETAGKDKLSELTKLYKLQSDKTNN